MSSVYNGSIKLTVFGESHQQYIGLVMDGLKAGIKLDIDFIKQEVNRRRANNDLVTSRKEKDEFEIISGFYNGYTTGSPLTILVKNQDVKSDSYNFEIPRPSHADYVNYIKHNGYNDYRGGGHSSGRLTLLLVIAGAIAKQILKVKNVDIGSHLLKIQKIEDEKFTDENLSKIQYLNKQQLPLINENIRNQILDKIKKCKENNDSIGGIIECAVINLETGIGEPFFDSIESKISSLAFSIPGIKGIEFGLGFNFNDYTGKQVCDELYYENDKIKTKTNYNGGINGGISNGMPLIFRVVVKPTPSIGLPVNSINLTTKEEIELQTSGRHDCAIVLRCCVIVEAIAAIALLDLYTQRYGSDFHV